MFDQILFVCVGNICRSPIAEALARESLRDRSKPITVASAGLAAVKNAGAHPISIELMRERGIDLSAHVSRQLTEDMLRSFELVLTMEQWQVREVERLSMSARGKVFRLGHWGGFDIPDPNGRSREMFVEVTRLIDRGIADLQHVIGR